MEIRDPVHGNIDLSDAETPVIDSAEYQRLRAIKQLGFAEFSFPAATHNRYLHSIGVLHVAGLCFDQIFKNFPFSKSNVKHRMRSTLRLAALLHDVGHGPLSHTTEEVMPPLADLKIEAYKFRKNTAPPLAGQIRANHEDYTIKYITDSPLTEVLKNNFSDISPLHVASLIDKTLDVGDDFFVDQGIDFRPILSQLVSSELDCDRMDYLERDSYFCGTNYGRIDLPWMINNMTAYLLEEKIYLALNRRALYTFDDFMISRHHMHLMVYFHHKSIIYEEMLNRYLSSKDCSFHLPADINQYTLFNDYKLHEHLAQHSNPWAQRIAQRRPYKVLVELHSTADSQRPEKIKQALNGAGIDCIWASSAARLSKYHSGTPEDRAINIFVVDQYDKWDKPTPIDQSTEIFQRYQGTRIIDRVYVSPEHYIQAEKLLSQQRL
jgi:uncharacterized protein